MTGIAFPSTANDVVTAAGSSGTMTLAAPSAVADGDLLIAWICDRSTVSGTPAGWTQDASFSTNGVFTAWHLPVPSAAALPSSWSWTVGSRNAGALFRVTGASLSSPVAAVGIASSAGADTGAPNYSASLPLQLSGVTMAGGAVALTGTFWEGTGAPSGHVPGFSQVASVAAGGGRGGIGAFGAAGAGATGTITCASGWTSGTDGEDGILIALNAASASSPPGVPMASIIPPGFASPMAFQQQAWPAPAPLLAAGADSGTGAESGSAAATVSTSDTGTGADGGTVTASASDSDTGSGADAGTVTATASGPDAGSGADSGSASASVAAADTGTAAEGAAVAVSSADTGTASDSGSVTAAAIAGADTGPGADSAAVTASAAGPDSGHGTDSASAYQPAVLPPAAQLGGTATSTSAYGGSAVSTSTYGGSAQ